MATITVRYLVRGAGSPGIRLRARGEHDLEFTSTGEEAQAFKEATPWLQWQSANLRCPHRTFHSWLARSGHFADEPALVEQKVFRVSLTENKLTSMLHFALSNDVDLAGSTDINHAFQIMELLGETHSSATELLISDADLYDHEAGDQASYEFSNEATLKHLIPEDRSAAGFADVSFFAWPSFTVAQRNDDNSDFHEFAEVLYDTITERKGRLLAKPFVFQARAFMQELCESRLEPLLRNYKLSSLAAMERREALLFGSPNAKLEEMKKGFKEILAYHDKLEEIFGATDEVRAAFALSKVVLKRFLPDADPAELNAWRMLNDKLELRMDSVRRTRTVPLTMTQKADLIMAELEQSQFTGSTATKDGSQRSDSSDTVVITKTYSEAFARLLRGDVFQRFLEAYKPVMDVSNGKVPPIMLALKSGILPLQQVLFGRLDTVPADKDGVFADITTKKDDLAHFSGLLVVAARVADGTGGFKFKVPDNLGSTVMPADMLKALISCDWGSYNWEKLLNFHLETVNTGISQLKLPSSDNAYKDFTRMTLLKPLMVNLFDGWGISAAGQSRSLQSVFEEHAAWHLKGVGLADNLMADHMTAGHEFFKGALTAAGVRKKAELKSVDPERSLIKDFTLDSDPGRLAMDEKTEARDMIKLLRKAYPSSGGQLAGANGSSASPLPGITDGAVTRKESTPKRGSQEQDLDYEPSWQPKKPRKAKGGKGAAKGGGKAGAKGGGKGSKGKGAGDGAPGSRVEGLVHWNGTELTLGPGGKGPTFDTAEADKLLEAEAGVKDYPVIFTNKTGEDRMTLCCAPGTKGHENSHSSAHTVPNWFKLVMHQPPVKKPNDWQ